MSSNKRPEKVRVFSSRSTPAPGNTMSEVSRTEQGRRRGDSANEGRSLTQTPPQDMRLPASGDGSADQKGFWMLSVFFLLGCIAGGAVLSYYGLTPGIGK